jgi:CheY-like chemotaxis protein/DNA-binding XRE family transcriptional regulator
MLKQLRKNHNLTLAKFAKKLGVSTANLCDFEQGRKLPSPKRALEFGKRLHLPNEFMIELSLESSIMRDKLPYVITVKKRPRQLETTSTSKITLFIVEDDPRDIELTMRAFPKERRESVKFQLFRDGSEVLDYFFDENSNLKNTNLPTVILLDLKLPKVSGFEVLRRLKSNAVTCIVPVVIFTASTAEATLIESYKIGGNSFIIKPLNFEQYSEAIRSLDKYWIQVNQIPKHNNSTTSTRLESEV